MAAGAVDRVDEDGTGVLVRSPEPATGRVEVDVPGDLALGGDVLHQRERTLGVGPEDGDGIVPAVRDVHEPAVRMHPDLGGRAVPGEPGRERGSGRAFVQQPGMRLVAEARHGAEHLAVDVGRTAVRCPGQVPRSRARGESREGRRMRRERRPGRVERVDHHLVETEVGDEDEAVVRRKIGGVRVRLLLARRIDARAGVLDERRVRPERTVGRDRERHDAAAAVVGRDQGASGGIDVQVAGPAAHGGLLVDLLELAGGGVHAISGHVAARLAVPLIDLVGRVQMLPVGMDREEGRVGGLGDETDGVGDTGVGVEAEGVDAVALRSGVGADVGDEAGGVGGHGDGGGRGGADQSGDDGTGIHVPFRRHPRTGPLKENPETYRDAPIRGSVGDEVTSLHPDFPRLLHGQHRT